MLASKLPLWAIRDYESIFEESGFKIIQTHKTRYVLDIPYLEGNYWDRRLKSLDMLLPYKLYPLKKRFEFIEQIITHKNRKFIDSEGNLLIYKPTRFIELKTDPIIAYWEARNGDTMFKVQNCPRTFRASSIEGFKYLTYAKDTNKFYMYKLTNEASKPTRRKI